MKLWPNDTIVEFARRSGYRASLTSNAPNLRIGFTSPLPTALPPGWPGNLRWTSDWADLLAQAAGKHVAIAGEEAFIADTPQEAWAMAKRIPCRFGSGESATP